MCFQIFFQIPYSNSMVRGLFKPQTVFCYQFNHLGKCFTPCHIERNGIKVEKPCNSFVCYLFVILLEFKINIGLFEYYPLKNILRASIINTFPFFPSISTTSSSSLSLPRLDFFIKFFLKLRTNYIAIFYYFTQATKTWAWKLH